MNQAQSFLRRVRWKAYFHQNSGNDDSNQNNNNYEFKLNSTPPPKDYLSELENGIYDIIKNIESRSVRTVLQSKLKDNLRKVKSSGKITVFANKTADMYEMSKEEYDQLINGNVNRTETKKQKAGK